MDEDTQRAEMAWKGEMATATTTELKLRYPAYLSRCVMWLPHMEETVLLLSAAMYHLCFRDGQPFGHKKDYLFSGFQPMHSGAEQLTSSSSDTCFFLALQVHYLLPISYPWHWNRT